MTPRHDPPRLTERLLVRACSARRYCDDIVGDLRESHDAVAARRSRRFAAWWYRVQVLRLSTRYAFRRTTTRNERGPDLMDRFATPLKDRWRSLWKQPLMTVTIVATLALAIGANAAVFGVIDALVLHPLTLPNADRLVLPSETAPNEIGRRPTVSAADFLDWRRQATTSALARLTAFQWWDANLASRDDPERLQGFLVSPDFFSVLGVAPALGRAFRPDEEVPANARRVILSDGLWTRRFGADRDIVGQSIVLDGAPSIVVGVMPRGFDFPLGSELWAPLAFDEITSRNRTNHQLTVIGELRPGRSVAEAQSDLATIQQRLQREFPASNRQRGVHVYTLAAGMRDIALPAMLSLWQAAGLFVLLIACANIANLLLARGVARSREVAVRLALGSSRGRVVWESLLESALLTAIAVPLSLGVAYVLLAAMRAFMPARVIRFIVGWHRLGIDGPLLTMALACGAAAAVVFGVLPAIQLARSDVGETLKSEGRSNVSPGRQRVRRALVVAEVALALPLLVAATLSVSTVSRFLTGWQGYNPSDVLTMRVVLPLAQYPDVESRARFAAAVVERFGNLPGTRAVAASNMVPAIDTNATRAIEVAGQPVADPSSAPRVEYRAVTPQYFDVLRMPLLSGRAFADGDRSASEPVAIVSAAMALRFWPADSAIGQRVRIGNGPWLRVVGVSGDVIQDWFDSRNEPTLYQPLAQAPIDTLTFSIRTVGDPLKVVAEARRAVARVDPMQPVYEMRTLKGRTERADHWPAVHHGCHGHVCGAGAAACSARAVRGHELHGVAAFTRDRRQDGAGCDRIRRDVDGAFAWRAPDCPWCPGRLRPGRGAGACDGGRAARCGRERPAGHPRARVGTGCDCALRDLPAGAAGRPVDPIVALRSE